MQGNQSANEREREEEQSRYQRLPDHSKRCCDQMHIFSDLVGACFGANVQDCLPSLRKNLSVSGGGYVLSGNYRSFGLVDGASHVLQPRRPRREFYSFSVGAASDYCLYLRTNLAMPILKPVVDFRFS